MIGRWSTRLIAIGNAMKKDRLRASIISSSISVIISVMLSMPKSSKLASISITIPYISSVLLLFNLASGDYTEIFPISGTIILLSIVFLYFLTTCPSMHFFQPFSIFRSPLSASFNFIRPVDEDIFCSYIPLRISA